jgi:probable phosphoglycerate mutase
LAEGVLPKWGLSPLGEQQADAAGAALRQALGAVEAGRLRVFTSPFSRTLETAQRVAARLDIGPQDPRLQQAAALRERFFGAHELAGAAAYDSVWAADAAGTDAAPPGGGESVDAVSARLRAFVAGVEAGGSGQHVILVSHGDALSILAAALTGADLRRHRDHGLANCGVLRVPA